MRAAQGTAQMLASLLGVDEDEATTKLARNVAVRHGPGFEEWAREIATLIGRTVNVVDGRNGQTPDVQVLIGNAEPRGAATAINVAIGSDRLFVGTSAPPSLGRVAVVTVRGRDRADRRGGCRQDRRGGYPTSAVPRSAHPRPEGFRHSQRTGDRLGIAGRGRPRRRWSRRPWVPAGAQGPRRSG